MKTKFFENMSVEYKVPDETKIENGKAMQAMVVLDAEGKLVSINKAERTGRKTSPRNYLFQGKNFTLTLNTDDHIARGTLKLRANEDWETLRSSVMDEMEQAYDELMKATS